MSGDRSQISLQSVISNASDFVTDEYGSTAIEYAILAAFIGVAIASSIVLVGSSVNAFFVTIAGFF